MKAEKKPTAIDKAMEQFAETMIMKIESIEKSNWQKPWFTEGMGMPVSVAGRKYTGCNSLLLMMVASLKGYKYPVWGTFKAITDLNDDDSKPRIMITKGEKTTPVVYSFTSIKNKDTGEEITWDEYHNLDKDERDAYDIRSRQMAYKVLNIAQTNMETARPDLWEKLTKPYKGIQSVKNGNKDAHFVAIDNMIDHQSWHCPIKCVYQDQAYYVPSSDCITTPLIEQFKSNESFYGTLLHEMAHSTGHKSRLNRDMGMGKTAYATEELIAEMTAAVVMAQHGFSKHINQDSTPYIKCWLGQLKKEPTFIKDLLGHINQASKMIEEAIEKAENLTLTASVA